MTAQMARGMLIAVEGGDRGGKSTQCARIVEHLNAGGESAELFKFPDRTTPIGALIDAYLQCKIEVAAAAVPLLFSANRWECAERLEALLSSGTHVVLDRYAYSGVAYSAARGLPLAWCKAPDAGLPQPDLVLEVVLPDEERTTRAGFGGERYEQDEMQRAVALRFAELRGAEIASGVAWVPVDGTGDIASVSGRVLDALSAFRASFSTDAPLKRLSWI